MAPKSMPGKTATRPGSEVPLANERAYQALMDNLPQGIFIKDRDLVYLACNAVYASGLKLAREEIAGKTDFDLYPRELADKYRADDARVMQNGKVEEIEEQYLKDGEERWAFTVKTPLRDDQGEVTGVLGIFWDITERKRMEQQLRLSERELRLRNQIATVFLTVSDEEMYKEVLELVLQALESPYGVFGYIDDQGSLVVPTMTRTIWSQCQVPDKAFVFPCHTWGDSSWPRAIREKRTVYENAPSTLAPPGHIPITRHVSMPIIHQNRVVGLIQVANKEQDYTGDDLRLLETMGNAIAPVLDARLERERQEQARRQAETELQQHRDSLEQAVKERTAQLQQEVAEGRRREEVIQHQTQEIMELSTPVMQVWDGVVLAPLIGNLDSQRTQEFMERLLNAIIETNSPLALVDITGVPTVDTQTAQHLIDTISATRLLGAQVVLTGVRPAIAQTLVHLGIDLSGIDTRSSLASGLRLAMERSGVLEDMPKRRV